MVLSVGDSVVAVVVFFYSFVVVVESHGPASSWIADECRLVSVAVVVDRVVVVDNSDRQKVVSVPCGKDENSA